MLRRSYSDFAEIVREQLAYRDLLYQMTKRDLLLRYKQTLMGFGWAIFTPLLNTVMFSIIFTRVAPIATEVPYPVFAYCGLWAWNFTASALKFSVNSLTSNIGLVGKVYFPREIFPVSALLVSLVDFAVGAIPLVILMAYYGTLPGPTVLLLPVIVAIQVLFTMGLGLMLAMWNLFYRDVKYLFEVVIMVWMFGTSVIYPSNLLGGRLEMLIQLNPMTAIIDAYRAVLLYGQMPAVGPLSAAAGISIVTLLLASLAFHRSEFRFAESV